MSISATFKIIFRFLIDAKQEEHEYEMGDLKTETRKKKGTTNRLVYIASPSGRFKY